MAIRVGEKFGTYELTKELGRGGAGIVYEGYDPSTKKNIALKVANKLSFKTPKSIKHFEKIFFNEAHIVGQLTHPNIIKIFDAGVEEDVFYFVMELVPGGNTLKSYCHPDRLLSYQQIIDIIYKCADALNYAHKEGVIHRDVKPTNILLTEEMDVKFCDFGNSHLASGVTDTTMPTGFIGSPRYMSPEQAQEDVVTNQTDLFSLGIVLYELLTGCHPFATDSFSRLIYKITNEPPPPLKQFRPDIPEIFEKIIYRLLQKDPTNRYKTGFDLAGDIRLATDFLDEPDTGDHLNEQKKLSEMQALAFFSGSSDAEILEIMRVATWCEHRAGDEIIVQGEKDAAFYVVVSGNVEVYHTNKLIDLIQAGDCFGEMGYLTKAKRTATVRAKDTVHLLKLSDQQIDQMSLGCQLHFNRVFLRTLLERLSVTTSKAFGR